MATRKPKEKCSIAEWFGYRVSPTVFGSTAAQAEQARESCPFLTAAYESKAPIECIKSENSKGVCSIAAPSNGPLQDWVVCPYRVITSPIFPHATARLFGLNEGTFELVPANTLAKPKVRARVVERLKNQQPTFVFFMDKLGGEINLPGSPKSPEFKLDAAIVELRSTETIVELSRYVVLEVQTMDFHGSYQHAVRDLKDGLRLHRNDFPAQVQAHPEWASKRIEGPNIANVFKRTIYQTLFKLRLALQPECAGFVLALPQAVWDSWRPHLGAPELEKLPDKTWSLYKPGAGELDGTRGGWIYVFDIDQSSKTVPNPIFIRHEIRATAESLTKLAFDIAPSEAMAVIGGDSGLKNILRHRLSEFWPEAFGRDPKRRARNRADAM